VYRALSDDETVLVDESMTPCPGYLLANQPWADVRFVQLVRHPQDVVGSMQRPKDYLRINPPEAVARNWLRAHLTAEFVRLRTGQPWLVLPYTQLVNDPDRTLTEILCHPPSGLRQENNQWAFTAPANHIYKSNPDKLKRGTVTIRPATSNRNPVKPGAGKWQYLANKYWKHRFGERGILRSNWT